MSFKHRALTAAVFSMFMLRAPVSAQTALPTAYDVSTVKPVSTGNDNMGINWGSAEMKADNVTLPWLMTFALHARKDQISGMPSWAKDKHFDITAKLTDTDKATLDKMTPDQHRALMLALLAERFGLKYHIENKDLPIYDLVPAKGGLKLTPAANSGDKTKEVNGVCSGCSYGGDTEIKGHDIEISAFVEALAGQLGRDILNDTGYTGKIDYHLKWAPDLAAKADAGEDASQPPLPQALEQQMGLHLVSTRGPVKLYVVDHMDEPSAN